MKEKKLYLPISEKFDIAGFTNSRDGIVVTLLLDNQHRFHVTIIVEKENDNYIFSIHVTDELLNKRDQIYKISITKEMKEDLEKKSNLCMEEIIPIIKKYVLPHNVIDFSDLYCVDCIATEWELPKGHAEAQEFWKSIESVTVSMLKVQCDNTNHKVYFDNKAQILVYKVNNLLFLGCNPDQLSLELGEVFEKYFFNEFQVIEGILRDISKTTNSLIS